METKKKIMDSAFRLFADKGNFSLNEVAKEFGYRKPRSTRISRARRSCSTP
jgi:AcrR family transcriptional regulator